MSKGTRAAFLALTALVFCACSPAPTPGPPSGKDVALAAAPTSVVSGGTVAITVSTMKAGSALGGVGVTLDVKPAECGYLDDKSLTTGKDLQNDAAGYAKAKTTFHGTSDLRTCAATITATDTNGKSTTAVVTVTPKPITLSILDNTGTPVPTADDVQIIPDIASSCSPSFSGTYSIKLSSASGRGISQIAVTVKVASSIAVAASPSGGPAAKVTPAGTATLTAKITEPDPNPEEETVTIKTAKCLKVDTNASLTVYIGRAGLFAKSDQLPGPTPGSGG